MTPVEKRQQLNRLVNVWKQAGHIPDVAKVQAQAAMVLIAENLWLRDQVPDSTYRMMLNDARGLPLGHGI